MDLYRVRQQLNMGVPLTSMKLRVTDYSRVSTDHEEQQNSLKNQIEHFDEMIKSNENWTYVPGYVDDGISGTTDYKRDNFMQMIEDAHEGKFDLIVTKEISRFSRNTLDSIKYTRELLSYGVAVLFTNDNINTALPDSELRLTIMASMAQDEIRRLSERVKFGMNRSIKNGNILGNNQLYGYQKDKTTGNLYIIKEEADNVKELFNLYTTYNYSLNKIAQIFNEKGIKTSLNKKWCSSTLLRMLKNPKYKGYYCGKKSEIIDYMTKKKKYFPMDNWVIYKDYEKIPPIIDEYLWQKAQDKLNLKKKKVNYQNRYPLSSKIYCGYDNETFHRRVQCKENNDITWVCAKYLKEGKKACSSVKIRETELKVIIMDILKELKINLNNVINILLNLYRSFKENNYLNNQIENWHKEYDKILIKKNKLLDLNMEGVITKEEFIIKNNEYKEKIEDILKKINYLGKKNKQETFKEDKDLEDILKLKIQEEDIQNKIIELLINKIIARKINNQDIELEIYLNYEEKLANKESFITKTYTFKRGYNISCTKRYLINYFVKIFYFNQI